jgi:phosphoribosyl-AMP cyclohydrolase
MAQHDELLAKVKFNDLGLVVAIAQSAQTGRVLMQAWMNAEAVKATVETGEAVYYSRSRAALWHKGETSGNTQKVHKIELDCDGDALLLHVSEAGPACHNGTESCFDTVSLTLDDSDE